MIRELSVVGLITAIISNSAHAQRDPYRVLRTAYATVNDSLAASAYADAAEYAERRPDGQPTIMVRGQASIRAKFAGIFREHGLRTAAPGDLNFRIVARKTDGDTLRDSGFYRVVVGDRLARRRIYGRFITTIVDGRFISDESGGATEADFESVSGPVLLDADDEELTGSFYDALTGDFGAHEACGLLVTRSVIRLFLLDECTGEWRRLSRENGTTWTAGVRVVDSTVTDRLTFDIEGTRAISVTPQRAARGPFARRHPYRLEHIRFGALSRIAGTVYAPTSNGSRRPGIVLIHGSGEQDRNGYASYIAVLAHHLAASGAVVLTYDKRGVGLTAGDWNSAGFRELASDAIAGMTLLRSRTDVDTTRVGLGGSSQAGWVAATAIRDGGAPAFTMLIGAAGSALTVEEQNLYNTRVRMTCDGLSEPDIRLGLQQQRAFFAARRSPTAHRALAAISARAMARPALREWLFPATVARNGPPQWYDVLDPDFDPLPIWRKFPGRMFFLFGSLDDSTPAVEAASRLRGITRATVVSLRGAQHLGLEASALCDAGLTATHRFHPQFFSTLAKWVRLF
jgi:dienelactone hydrolase